MVYIKNLVGVDYISLGSDWDGSIAVSVDSPQVIHITNALLASKKFSKQEIEKIMGGNIKRFLLENLRD